jgi:hypothetical protein
MPGDDLDGNSVKSRPPPSELKGGPAIGEQRGREQGSHLQTDGDATDINSVIRESSPLQICHEQRILLSLASYFDPVSASPFDRFNRPAVTRLSRR